MNKRQEQPSTVQPITEQPRETDKPGPEQETAPTQLSPEELELRNDLISAKNDGWPSILLEPPTKEARIIAIHEIYDHLQKQIQRKD